MFVGKVCTTTGKVATGVVVAGAAAGAVYLADPDLFNFGASGSGDDDAAENAMASVQRDQDQGDASLGTVDRDEVYDPSNETLDIMDWSTDFDVFDQDGSRAIETDEMKISRESAVEWLANRTIFFWDRWWNSMEELEELKIDRLAEAEQEFDRLDTNHDNMLHIDEVSYFWLLEADWAAHDLNGDGHWNLEEVMHKFGEELNASLTVKEDAEALTLAQMEQMWQENYPASGDFNFTTEFNELNHQGGNTLEPQEFASVEVQAWDTLDANQDGKATLSERVSWNRQYEPGTTTEEKTPLDMLLDHFFEGKLSETA